MSADPFDVVNNVMEGGGVGLTGPPSQINDAALRAAQLSTGTSSSNRFSAFPISGSRRQSQLPPSSMSNVTRQQPRKSIGPGYSIPTAREKPIFDPVPRSTNSEQGLELPASRRTSHAVGKNRSAAALVPSENAFAKPGSFKGLSINTTPLQPQSSNTFLDLPPASSSFTNGGEGRSPMKQTTFPSAASSSGSKRQSTAVGHVGSLGARTISPTDVRRSRRMSVSSRAPPIPLKSRSPTPELTFGERPPPTPPFSLRQKSMTPSSPQEAPELPRRQNSGRSSRSSYTSARPTSSSSQRRSSFNNFNARSPTTKSRNLPSAAGVEIENVPPVPAIPKAYESPSEVIDKPFFSEFPPTVNETYTSQPNNRGSERFATPDEGYMEAFTKQQDARQNRRLTLGARPHEGREVPRLNTGQHQVSSTRLPPLNLLPLSTPTTSKIAALAQKSADEEQGKATPPPYRNGPKTPSTPMTASKATFPSYDFHHNFDLNLLPSLRSSTSYAAQKSETSTLNESGSDSPAIATPASPASTTNRHGASPFQSFSLPRPSGDMQANRKHRESVKDSQQHGRRSSKSLIRRPSNVSKNAKEASNNTHAFTDTETTNTGSTLRRKLSLGWRRSSSKASHVSHHPDDDSQAAQAATDMPPPKVPASSVRNTGSRKEPKLSSNLANSQTDLGVSLAGSRSANTSTNDLSKTSQRQSMKVDTSHPTTKSSNSLFSPMQRMLGSRSSSHNVKSSHRGSPALDREDQAAEDEMKKLGSKKKEFEASARELENLRRRAAAKERVSPTQAARVASLNIFEKGEIIDYKSDGVYFCGTKDAKKFVGDLGTSNTNFGFDDERGDYNIVMGDHLAYRYEVIDMLGKGSFGQVVRCVDHKTGGLVAVKIIRNKKRFHQQALVEVNILQKIREWVRHSETTVAVFPLL